MGDAADDLHHREIMDETIRNDESGFFRDKTKQPGVPTMSEEMAVVNQASTAVQMALTPKDVTDQVQLIQQVMKDCMTKDEHFGTIPGCGKKEILFKSGAEKLSLIFKFAPSYDVKRSDYDKFHREYEVVCTITHIPTQNIMAQGVGACSTMEGKYKFRQGDKEITSNPVPREYWDVRKKDPAAAQKMIGGAGFGTKKTDDGQWMITKGGGEKVEHDNPADYWNTCLKMAKKRAYVDAMLSATAASDIFTQDIEDMPEVIPAVNHHQQAAQQPQQGQQQQAAQQAQSKPQPPQQQQDQQKDPRQELHDNTWTLYEEKKAGLDAATANWAVDSMNKGFYQEVINHIKDL